MRKTTSLYPILSILFINIIPVIGVLCLGWNVYQLITTYWIESLLIGVFNLLKMAMAQKPSKDSAIIKVASKIGLMAFFCFHYFFFLLILGLFVFVMVIGKHPSAYTVVDISLMIVMLIGGCTSSFIIDYILPKKYLSTAPSELLIAPYGRVWVLTVLIFAGGFISHEGMENSYFYLMVLVIAKLSADLVPWVLNNRTNLDTRSVG